MTILSGAGLQDGLPIAFQYAQMARTRPHADIIYSSTRTLFQGSGRHAHSTWRASE